MTKKYELTDITQVLDGTTLYRIRALKNFRDVRIGDLGGWVSSPNNLSQEGDCWMYDESCMFDDSHMYEDSCITDNSRMYDRSRMYDDSRMHDDSRMYDNSHMYDDSCITDNSHMHNESVMREKSIMHDNSRMYDRTCMRGNSVMREKSIMRDKSRLCDSIISNLSLHNDTVLTNTKLSLTVFPCIKKTPILISGHPFKIAVVDDHLIIGCRAYTLSQWRSFDDYEILQMTEGNIKLLKIWNLNKESIFKIVELHQTMEN